MSNFETASEEASAVIAEIEDIFWGAARGAHSDANLAWLKSQNMNPEDLLEVIKAMRAGEVRVFNGQAFVKTHDNKFQAAEAYILKVEKAVIKLSKAQEFSLKENQNLWEHIRNLEAELTPASTFWGRIKQAFKLVF